MDAIQDDALIQITGCEVCGAQNLSHVLDLGRHPLCDDLIAVGDPRRSATYPISLSYCATCSTVHQDYQIPKRLLFPTSYHYRARHTKDVLDGMRQLVERCIADVGSLEGLTVLDIGCNDGSLLSIFAEHGTKTVGIEPTGAAADARAAGHAVYENYFDCDVAAQVVKTHGHPDVITFTNVFAHIEDLSAVIAALRDVMCETTVLVIENHYLGAVLDRYQFDTFYHEHPRTYARSSFDHIAASLGMHLAAVEFPARYGGNIRVLMKSGPAPDAADAVSAESGFEARLRDMNERIPRWSASKRATLQALVDVHGPLCAKAFPGRAAILIELLGLDETMISAVYEKPGSMKIGHYVPGTRIPIVSDDAFADRASKDAPLVNFAWHISTEIHTYLRNNGFEGEIVDLFSPAEFEAA